MTARHQFTEKEVDTLWAARKRGATLSEIARGLDCQIGAVFRVVRRHGGCAPKPHRRAARALTNAEREDISRGVAAGKSVRAIARELKRAASTVSRELGRHGGRQHYRAQTADTCAWQRARRPQPCRLASRPRLRQWVSEQLSENWSPRQIAVGLRRHFPDDAEMRVSHETIYKTLFVQARGTLKAELIQHLRRAGKLRHSRRAQAPAAETIPAAVSIRERPAEAEDRAVPGHWEGDLLMGGNSSQIATLVERQSRYVMLVKLASKDTETVVKALAAKVQTLPKELRRTLTWDRGTEMAAHREFTVATAVQVYFCDPRSPWQRGSNENTNGLLRQYFPKGHDVSSYSQQHLDRVAQQLNERPRETLQWLTPLEALQATVATTA